MTSLVAVREILESLVAFDTTSRNSNLALIEWVEARLEGVAVHVQRLPNTAGDKSNLWVRVGPDVAGGVILSGHTDVVPVDGQPWTASPWELTQRGSRLYGRGASDMKGFIALCLAYADRFAKAPLTRPVHFAFSYDEEIGCAGAQDMIDAIAAASHPPALCWVGEPTLWGVVSGHKGIRTYEVAVTGHEAHSSLPHLGVSAIHEAIDLMVKLRAIADDAEANPPEGAAFDPPYATLTIGVVQGGTAGNILARDCRFQFDLRTPPGVDPDHLLAPFMAAADSANARLRELFPECGVMVTRNADAPSLTPESDSAAERFVRAITGDNSVRLVGYAAEAGQFQRAGFSTVICGPGSIEQAHQPDEWIEESQLARGVEVFDRLVAALCRG